MNQLIAAPTPTCIAKPKRYSNKQDLDGNGLPRCWGSLSPQKQEVHMWWCLDLGRLVLSFPAIYSVLFQLSGRRVERQTRVSKSFPNVNSGKYLDFLNTVPQLPCR